MIDFRITGTLAALLSVTTVSQAATIAFEAESGVFGTASLDGVGNQVFNTITDPTASGGEAVEPSAASFPTNTAAFITYELEVETAGEYFLYARVRRLTGTTTGVDLRTSSSLLNATPITNGNFLAIWGSGVATPGDITGATDEFALFNLSTGTVTSLGFNGTSTFNLTPGTINFQLSNRNDNVVIDALALSTNANLTEAEFLQALIIPEPTSLSLAGFGMGLMLLRRRR